MGASILPVTLINGQVYLLFGKERAQDQNPGWSDFGGGIDKGETPWQTAIREGGEELTGFLGNVRALLTRYGTFQVVHPSDNPRYGDYHVHIFPMEYDPMLEHYYNNNQRFLQKRLPRHVIRDSKLFEKTEIQWMPLLQLAKQRPRFRTFYRNIIDQLWAQRQEIANFCRRHLRPHKRKTRKNRH